MQKQLSFERVTGLSNDGTFAVTLNGNQELLSVNISPDVNLNHPEIEKNIKEAFDDAQAKLKKILSEKLGDMI